MRGKERAASRGVVEMRRGQIRGERLKGETEVFKGRCW